MINCRVCGKPDPEHIFHCTAHYKCEDCGKTEGLTTRTNELTCDACHAIRAKKIVSKFRGNTDCTREITCPWCGHEKMDSWEESDSGEHECGYCGNEYEHCRDVVVTYGTSKIAAR